MSSPQATLDVARSQLGVTETPFGSNRTPYGEWYGMNGVAWCGEFVSWVAAHSGADLVIPKYAYTPSGAAWFKSHGSWHAGVAGALPGDVLFFTWPGMGRISHTGFVEAVLGDGSLITIEGNTDAAGGRTGGKVMRHTRRANVTGFGRPAYDGASVASAPVVVIIPQAPGQLAVDGSFGPGTKRRLQQSLNTTGANPQLVVDGDFGPRSYTALQMRLHFLVGDPDVFDGKFGPVSTRALQKALGVSQDGVWGSGTTTALQHRLNAGEL